MTEALGARLDELRQRMREACGRAGRSPDSVRLVAVTKAASDEQIRAIVELGVRELGENRVQVLEKHAALVGSDVCWHMIGHLQRNKVKQVLPMVSMVQSLDSQRLADEIQTVAGRMGRTVPVLLEVNAGEEAQKSGAALAEAGSLAGHIATLPNLQLQGVMSMAPLTDDVQLVRKVFARAREFFEQLRQQGIGGENLRELSMGMSHDFEVAIEEGATIVRVGSALFDGH